MASIVSDFQKLINEARERKKNSALADKIFGRDRKHVAPSEFKPTVGGSLASRVGVRKQRAPTTTHSRASLPAGSANGDGTNSLDISLDGDAAKSSSLNARIMISGAGDKRNGAPPRRFKPRSSLATALRKMMAADQANVVSAPPPVRTARSTGITIRGLAGPYAVMGQNFAPGTTEADIESAMTPVGGEMVSCTIVKTSPFLVAEMVFLSREGGEHVIKTFNNKIADGRIIQVYPKADASNPATASRAHDARPANAPRWPGATPSGQAASRDQVVDGTMGFPEVTHPEGPSSSYGTGNGNHGLYSDHNNKAGVGGHRKDGFFHRNRGRGGAR